MKKDDFSGGPVSHPMFASVVDGLKGLGLIDHEPGRHRFLHNPFDDTGRSYLQGKGRAAHFRATQVLLDTAARFGVMPEGAAEHFILGLPDRPLVLKAASTRRFGQKVSGREMRFDPTPETERLEAEVKRLNEFLDGFDIRGGTHRGFRRIFNQGDQPGFAWDKGGRLYSQGENTYQQLKKHQRLAMTIDGEPVVEIDIRASYLTMLYGLLGQMFPPGSMGHIEFRLGTFDPSKDPYDIPDFDRDVVKLWTVATLGSSGLGRSSRTPL